MKKGDNENLNLIFTFGIFIMTLLAFIFTLDKEKTTLLFAVAEWLIFTPLLYKQAAFAVITCLY